MRPSPLALALLSVSLGVTAFAARAADDPPANEQVVVPQVERRDVPLPRFPSKDVEIGLFVGTYSAQNFGAKAVAGERLGYHLSEDIFVEAAYGQSKVSDEWLREVFGGVGVFPEPSQTLKYLNLSAGYNVLPGEVFLGSRRAKATALYLIGGVGSTRLAEQRRQTINVGVGLRLLLAERWALRLDVRDHVFSYDLLGAGQNSKSTQNLELTAGFSHFF